MLSKRIQALSPSMTIAISTLAAELRAEGKDVLGFSAGEPDFDTPQPIKEAAVDAIKRGFTKYTPVAGIPELLDAIAGKLKRDNGLEYQRNMILVSNGAKQSLFNLTQAIIDEEDEVIIPAPYWVTYPELVKYAGGKPVIIETDETNGFKITPEQLRAAITPQSKLLILTSPSNPTGAVYSREELEALAKVLEGTEILVASDEMYEKLDNGLEYQRNMILVSNGAKQSLFNLTQAIIDEEDEVIIPAPYWVTYPELVKYAGGKPVIIETDETNGFKITPEQLRAAITPQSKLLILTSPSNPTGAVYSREELEALAKVLEGTEILVASDEMYEKLVYDGTEFTATASISEDMYRRTVTINGLSKSVAMTGWRMGYLACPDTTLVKKMTSLQSQSTSNICSITQKAAIPALDGTVDDEIEQMRRAFEARAHEAVELFNAIDGLSVTRPQGAFYLFVNIKELGMDSMKFSEELLSRYGVAVVPGIGFGAEGYFRFSFATDIVTIREGVRRIEKFVSETR